MNSDNERQYEKVITIGKLHKMDKVAWPSTSNRHNYTDQYKSLPFLEGSVVSVARCRLPIERKSFDSHGLMLGEARRVLG